MREPTVPIVQLALDYPSIDDALRMAEIGVKAGVDILEAGTPLIVSQGVAAIGRLAKAFPEYPILADYKTMDSGGRNVHITKAQGGHYMTVCANAADETVQAAINAKREVSGVQVVVDTIGVKDQPGRARLCEQWGADMIYLHYAADQRRADATREVSQSAVVADHQHAAAEHGGQFRQRCAATQIDHPIGVSHCREDAAA